MHWVEGLEGNCSLRPKAQVGEQRQASRWALRRGAVHLRTWRSQRGRVLAPERTEAEAALRLQRGRTHALCGPAHVLLAAPRRSLGGRGDSP